MPTLTIQTALPPDTYDRRTGKLHARQQRFLLDGWPLLADNLRDAVKEVQLMGEAVDKIEPEH